MDARRNSVVEREFTRAAGLLSDILAFVESFCESHTIPPSVRFAISLSVDEMVTNIMRHQPENSSLLKIGLALTERRVIVTIVDRQSVHFDPTLAKDPQVDLPIDQRKPGGLGIFLTKKMMDEVQYEFREGTGTTTLIKELES